jgi:hypothetical protein
MLQEDIDGSSGRGTVARGGFLDPYTAAAAQIVVDLDATDEP